MLQRINLVPQTPVAQRLRRLLPLVLGALLCGIVLFLYADHARLTAKRGEIDREIEKIEAQLRQSSDLQTSLKQLADSVSQRRQQQVELQTRVATLSQQFQQKRNFSRLLLSISRLTPTSVKCDKIMIKEQSGLITGSAVQYRELPELVSSLQADPMFKRVSLQDIDRTTQAAEGRFLFTISFELH